MKILAITSSYPRYEGDPTAPFVESIVRSVAAHGNEVHVLLPRHRAWSRVDEESVRYHPYRYSPVSSWTPWGFSESLEGGVRIRKSLYALAPLVLAAAAREARRVLAGGGFDVVHVHWVVPNGPVGAAVTARHGVPLLTTLHGSDVAVAERSPALGRAARWALERSAAVTAPSGDLLERATRLGATGSLELVPYGADVDTFDLSAEAGEGVRRELGIGRDHVVVAGIGRLIPVKGFEYLVDAHAAALPEAPQLRLVLVGGGDGRRGLEERARAVGVADTVVFVGEAERREIPRYLAAADIVAVPSIHYGGYVDGLPNVALEAMAAGKPVIGSRVGGIPELVRDGDNGVLVPEKDSRALAAAIVDLARDRELRSRLGRAARNEMRTSRSWSSVGRRFVDIYERLART